MCPTILLFQHPLKSKPFWHPTCVELGRSGIFTWPFWHSSRLFLACLYLPFWHFHVAVWAFQLAVVAARDFVMGDLHWFLALLYGECALPVEFVWTLWRFGETFGDLLRSLVLSIAVSIIGHVLDVSG